jgi:hypothetical protein
MGAGKKRRNERERGRRRKRKLSPVRTLIPFQFIFFCSQSSFAPKLTNYFTYITNYITWLYN